MIKALKDPGKLISILLILLGIFMVFSLVREGQRINAQNENIQNQYKRAGTIPLGKCVETLVRIPQGIHVPTDDIALNLMCNDVLQTAVIKRVEELGIIYVLCTCNKDE